MPLPDHDQEWPPPHIRREMRLYEEWGAWYAGDPDQLAQVYGASGMMHGIGLDPKGWDRPSKGFTGWIQRAARYFWGTPVPLGQVRSTKLHVPIAGDRGRSWRWLRGRIAGLLERAPPPGRSRPAR
ncbi:hypothetical protein OHA25_16605 [Nonomuraea sp. NBC_00507]|uniref:hypothetical protein n=1 Tax=Nonomuraea sp. NBC_00507 TaxID=2976002 RepID=UPI002E180881